ncbi:MAG: hypothetical protein ABH822_02645 [Patescibacteria group bacterium]
MTTQTYEKIKREIKQELVQEFVLPILREAKDPEGEYREEFVKRILKAAKEKHIYTYNPKTFLKQISS